MPIGMPGNAGLNDGVSAPLDSDSVTFMFAWVKEAAKRTLPTCGIGRHLDALGRERLRVDVRGSEPPPRPPTGMPNCGSRFRLTDSTRS